MAFCSPLLLLVIVCFASQVHAVPAGKIVVVAGEFEVQETLLNGAVSSLIGQINDVTLTSDTNGCQCSGQTKSCSCCQSIHALKIQATVCIIVAYLPSNIGFSLTFTINGKVVFKKEISVKNPPPICLKVPELGKLAKICLEFYNIDWGNKMLKGCSRGYVSILGKRIVQFDFGCFSLGPFADVEELETDESADAIQNEMARLEKQSGDVFNFEKKVTFLGNGLGEPTGKVVKEMNDKETSDETIFLSDEALTVNVTLADILAAVRETSGSASKVLSFKSDAELENDLKTTLEGLFQVLNRHV